MIDKKYMQLFSIFMSSIFMSPIIMRKIKKPTSRLGVLFTLLALLVVITSTSFMATKSATAQTGIDLTVTPPVAYLHVKPGMRDSHVISLDNTGSSALRITPEIVSFSTDPQTGRPILGSSHDFEHFVSLEQQLQPVLLQPGQKAQLSLAIAPPQSAAEKEYPLSVVFRAKQTSQSQTESPVEGLIVSNLIILVSQRNELPKQLNFADHKSLRFLDSFSPLDLGLTVKNEGLAATTASGSARVKNLLGKEIVHFDFYPDNVLGFSQRPLRALDPEGLDSIKPMQLRLDKGFLIGPYIVEYTLNNENTNLTANTIIIAVPIFGIIALIVGAIIAVWYWQQKIRKNPFIA